MSLIKLYFEGFNLERMIFLSIGEVKYFRGLLFGVVELIFLMMCKFSRVFKIVYVYVFYRVIY